MGASASCAPHEGLHGSVRPRKPCSAAQAIYATVPAGAVKALKGKKSKLTVSVQVANTAGIRYATAKNAVAKIRG